jgi:hypothetical protein
MDTLKLKKAWEVALGPIKSLPMTAIMMYMSGNSLQIFSIMMVFMAFKNPIMGILATNQAFERFETDTNRAKIVQVKLAYVVMQLVALALGIWKVNGMGLLPCVCGAPLGGPWLTEAQDNEVGLACLGSAARSRRACRASVIDAATLLEERRICGRCNCIEAAVIRLGPSYRPGRPALLMSGRDIQPWGAETACWAVWRANSVEIQPRCNPAKSISHWPQLTQVLPRAISA